MASTGNRIVGNSIVCEEPAPHKEDKKLKFEMKFVWYNVIHFLNLHACFIYGFYLCVTSASWKTALFAYMYGNLGLLGITAGVHRLWSHRSYKAKLPLRVLLCCLFCIANQGTVFKWSRDHRVHHKYSDTDADPFNIRRGFFYGHIGCHMSKKHPEVSRKGKTIFLDDLKKDPIVIFHTRFYTPMYVFFCYFLPTIMPVYCWGETVSNSFYIAAMAGHCYTLNVTWLLNSVGHTYGTRPYDKYIRATDNVFNSILFFGEGFHNYHHAFPWDYAASELGYKWNVTKLFIDFMALIGQAYDLKSAIPESVKNRKLKTGDGTRTKVK